LKITFFGNGNRGLASLKSLFDSGYQINCIVAHPDKRGIWQEHADSLGVDLSSPADPNEQGVIDFLKSKKSELFVLAGYGKIIKDPLIRLPKFMCLNLHAGKLPQYRGSSPMNWVLINGEETFTLSVIKVDKGVDTGDIVLERTFDIGTDNTIVDLHQIANHEFPDMLVEAIRGIEDGSIDPRPQNEDEARYFPLRFPDDGLIIWDMFTAEQIHNRIRALTEPYPCAFTYFNGRKVKLIFSALTTTTFLGEPGRIYQKTPKGLLVCANDRSLWITSAVFQDGHSLLEEANRYETFITAKWSAIHGLPCC
jgi:methionyl-tRNA formyltransferase